MFKWTSCLSLVLKVLLKTKILHQVELENQVRPCYILADQNLHFLLLMQIISKYYKMWDPI